MTNATKRVLAASAAALLTVSGLVATETAATAASSANTFTVTAPTQGGGAASPYKALVDAFNAKYPTYKAILVEEPTATYDTAVVTKLRAGNASDVFKVQPGTGVAASVIDLAKAKYLAPISSTGVKKLIPAALRSVFEVNGKPYAVPLDQTVGAIVSNHTLMKADGVTWPTSFAGLLTECKAARAKGKTFFGLAGGMFVNNGLAMMSVTGSSVYANGATWNAKRVAGKTTFAASPEWNQDLSKFVQMSDAGCFQDGAAAGGFKDAIDDRFFGKKSYAIFVPGGTAVGFSHIPFFADQTLKVQAFPGAKRLPVGVNYALGVNAKTKKAAAVKKFINFTATAAAQAAYQKVSGNLAVGAIDEAKAPVQYSEVVGLVNAGKIYPFPNQAWNAEVYQKIGTGIQGLLNNQAAVYQVLRSADGAWKK